MVLVPSVAHLKELEGVHGGVLLVLVQDPDDHVIIAGTVKIQVSHPVFVK
jgi:hypothetical protein